MFAPGDLPRGGHRESQGFPGTCGAARRADGWAARGTRGVDQTQVVGQ